MTDPTSPDSPQGQFTVAFRHAADGGIWTVLSPGGVSVWRTHDLAEAANEAIRRNGGVSTPEGQIEVVDEMLDRQWPLKPAQEVHAALAADLNAEDSGASHLVQEPPC